MHKQVCLALMCIVLGVQAALAQGAPAQPQYFAVVGVADDDVLNIRADPTASAEIIGTMAAHAGPVEVLRIEDGWAYLSAGERMGWASARYLAETAYRGISDSLLPDGMICLGTEPFWSLSLADGQALFHSIDQPGATLNISQAAPFGGAGPQRNFILAAGASQNLTAITSNELCSDGMSDRDYPRRVDLVISDASETRGYTGCCHLPLQ